MNEMTMFKGSKTMMLIYDGALAPQVCDHVKDMLKSYPAVVEIDKLPEGWNEWRDANFPKYTTAHEGSMGEHYTREQTLYGLVWKNFGVNPPEGAFLFFKSETEQRMFVNTFYAHVINPKPFKTGIL